MSKAGQSALRGVMIAGPLLAVCGAMGGTLASMGWDVPVPPIITTEAGAFLGCVLGATVGFACASRAGRCVMLGIALAAPLAAGLGWLMSDGAHAMGMLARYGLLGVILGGQLGYFLSQPPPHGRGPGAGVRS